MGVGVLALTKDGRLTRCVAPPDKRGIGKCMHIMHQEDGELDTEFMQRAINPNVDKTYDEIKMDFVKENRLDFNKPINWSEVISPKMIKRYINFPETPNIITECESVREVNADGDDVDHLYIKLTNPDELDENGNQKVYTCDFGEVPALADDGTISIQGVRWVPLPVMDKNKVGYSQGYNAQGKRTIWLLQKDGNLGITIPEDSDKWRILGKEYDADYVRQCLINGGSEDPKLNSIINCLDTDIIKERFPDFATEDFDKKMFDQFQKDRVNDFTYRRIHTYEDQVKQELEAQLRRMGVTYRQNLMKGNGIVLYQKNNTSNIKENLIGRSNVQLADDTNPISLYSQTHKISLVGREGYNKDDVPAELRDVHDSHRGITDPLDQSSGKSIGLTVFMNNCQTSRGFIEPGSVNPNGLDGKSGLNTSDFVPFKYHNNPNRVQMSCSQIRQAVPIVGGEDPYQLNDPSDKAWMQVSGAKIGVNLRAAYISTDISWEDSYGVSESAAKKLGHVKEYKFPYDQKMQGHIGKTVKVGQKIGGVEVRNGGVLSERNGKMYVKALVPFGTGDKIAGRVGNKGTVVIVPDEQMPKVYDVFSNTYKPAEVVMSPLSTGKRSNIGIQKEMNQTMDASKPVVLPDGKTVQGAHYGYQYIMRLNQMASEKYLSHGVELDTKGEIIGNRMGEMGGILLGTTEARRQVLNQLRSQNPNKNMLKEFMKGIGVHCVQKENYFFDDDMFNEG